MDASWVAKWRGLTVFVLGDVMLDKFVHGRVERISPEAPIPVLHFQSERVMLGGAANVARNVVALGGKALLVGMLGEDAEGDLVAGPLLAVTGSTGASSAALATRRRRRCVTCPAASRSCASTLKDHELDLQQTDTICGWLLEDVDRMSAVVLSDYAKGLLVPAVIRV